MLNIRKFLRRNDNKRKLIGTLKLWCIGVLILSSIKLSPISFFYNHTISMPIGLYLVNFFHPTLKKDDLVIACLPNEEVAKFAILRGYILHSNHSCNWNSEYLLKRIKAVPGDVIEIRDKQIYINDTLLPNSKILNMDSLDRPLTSSLLPLKLGNNEYLIFGDEASSYDSRYFGIIKTDNIKGNAYPIYTKGNDL